MKTIFRVLLMFVFVSVLVSCKKKTEPSAREEQLQNEITQPLLPNEILEQEGIRFVLDYSQAEAKIGLSLDKRNDDYTPATLTAYQPYVNYSVEASKLAENSDYIMSVEFNNVTKDGSFSLSVIGFTDLNMSKAFVLSGNNFTMASNQTSKSFLKIHKGIRKFTFYKL